MISGIDPPFVLPPPPICCRAAVQGKLCLAQGQAEQISGLEALLYMGLYKELRAPLGLIEGGFRVDIWLSI